MLQESIIFSVFDMLLAVETNDQVTFVNDDTVEGAQILMNKVGHILDEKIRKVEALIAQGGESVKLKKSDKQALKFKEVFSKFEDYAGDSSICSLRVRMLIKNLMENRAKGWEKTKK